MDCPLCTAAADEELLQATWAGLIESSYAGVVSAASIAGIALNERDARRHFEYHYPIQPRAARFSRETYRAQPRANDRQLALVDLVRRVPGLDGEALGRMIYWSGDPTKRISAEKSGLRNLKKLCQRGFLYRVFLGNLPGPSGRPLLGRGLYYLGRLGAELLLDRLQVQVGANEVVRFQDQLGSWPAVDADYRAASLFASLQEQLPGSSGLRWTSLREDLHLAWDSANWYSGRLLPRWDDPLSRSRSLNANGLAAFSVKRDEIAETHLLPFVYYHHNYRRYSNSLASDLLNVFDWERSGSIPDSFPALPVTTLLPTLVACADRDSFARLQSACAGLRPPRDYLALACVEADFDLFAPVWQPLFGAGSRAGRVGLVDALLNHYRSGGIPGRKLLRSEYFASADESSSPETENKPG